MAAQGCGAPAGGAVGTVDYDTQAVVQGRVVAGGSPVTSGYARLLDADGEFTAEVPLGGDGGFRFFAAPGPWTVRVLAPGGVRVDTQARTDYGTPADLEVTV